MDEKFYKVRIYDDNRITITFHEFIPFKTTKPLPSSRPDSVSLTKPSNYMSVKDYKRLLKSAHKKLWCKSFEQDKCYFITLTLNRNLSYKKLLKEFHRFGVYLKRKFGKFEYIRTIELQESTLRLHIHTIIQFIIKPVNINQSIIERLWGLGICNIEPIFDIWGVLQYITTFKEPHIQKNNPYYTCFTQGAKVISASQHFGVKIDCTAYRDEYISASHLRFILKHHFKEFLNGKGSFIRFDEHRYFNEKTGTSELCIDTAFIRTTKEFIENNFDILNDENKPP